MLKYKQFQKLNHCRLHKSNQSFAEIYTKYVVTDHLPPSFIIILGYRYKSVYRPSRVWNDYCYKVDFYFSYHEQLQGIKEPEAYPHNASGEMSPRVFASILSKLLITLNALCDLLSSSNSDLESMLSCTWMMREKKKIKREQSVIKNEAKE